MLMVTSTNTGSKKSYFFSELLGYRSRLECREGADTLNLYFQTPLDIRLNRWRRLFRRVFHRIAWRAFVVSLLAAILFRVPL